MPDTASAGVAQEADSAQLPQSTSPVVDWVRQLGWFCGRDALGVIVVIFRAPLPP
jgi:hypothetical protein